MNVKSASLTKLPHWPYGTQVGITDWMKMIESGVGVALSFGDGDVAPNRPVDDCEEGYKICYGRRL